MKEVNNIKWETFDVSATTLVDNEAIDKRNRIRFIITEGDTLHFVDMSKSNARWLVDKLKAAIKLA